VVPSQKQPNFNMRTMSEQILMITLLLLLAIQQEGQWSVKKCRRELVEWLIGCWSAQKMAQAQCLEAQLTAVNSKTRILRTTQMRVH